MTVTGIAADPQALATVERFKLVLGKDADDGAQDQPIQFFLNVASDAVMDYLGRDVIPEPGAGADRLFDYRSGAFVSFGRHDCQSVSAVVIDADTADPIVLSSGQYQLFPAPKTNGVWTDIRLALDFVERRPAEGSAFSFPWSGLLDPVAGLKRQVKVTGVWGWPSIPRRVEFATIQTAALWLQKNQETFSATFNLDTGRVELPAALPTHARKLLDRLRR